MVWDCGHAASPICAASASGTAKNGGYSSDFSQCASHSRRNFRIKTKILEVSVCWLNLRNAHNMVPGYASHYSNGIVEEKVFDLIDVAIAYQCAGVWLQIWGNCDDSSARIDQEV